MDFAWENAKNNIRGDAWPIEKWKMALAAVRIRRVSPVGGGFKITMKKKKKKRKSKRRKNAKKDRRLNK